MTPEERERAERIASRISAECSESDGCFDHDKCTDVLLAFSRKERARAYEEAAYYLEYRSSGPIPPDAIDHMKDCAKHLREEGEQR